MQCFALNEYVFFPNNFKTLIYRDLLKFGLEIFLEIR